MKKVLFMREPDSTIDAMALDNHQPVFAKDDKGKFIGMVVEEDKGWIIKVGGRSGASGHFPTLRECLSGSLHLGYSYFIE